MITDQNNSQGRLSTYSVVVIFLKLIKLFKKGVTLIRTPISPHCKGILIAWSGRTEKYWLEVMAVRTELSEQANKFFCGSRSCFSFPVF